MGIEPAFVYPTAVPGANQSFVHSHIKESIEENFLMWEERNHAGGP